MSRPVIGISSNITLVDREVWQQQRASVLNQAYVDHVERAGGVAMLIPPRVDAAEDFIEALLDHVDGLILSGGGDLAPELYDAERHSEVQPTQDDRDATELALARRAQERDLPLLGICRGMQVMAVAAGGSLEQHLPDVVGHQQHSPTVGVYASHPVRIEPSSLLGQILDEQMDVPTYHHQSVLTAPGFDIVSWASDGTIEAMEDRTARFRVGVQWHPEVSDDNRIFEALMRAAVPARL